MNAKPYQIATDPHRKLVSMSFDPVFWNDGVSKDFMRDCIDAVQSLGCDFREQLILVDLSHAVLQSKDIYQRMLGLVASATARRIALVASTPLARMQTKRLQIREGVILFDERTAAERWLFGANEAKAA